MIARRPVHRVVVVIRFAAFPTVFLAQQFPAVHAKNQAALVVVEHIVHVALVDHQRHAELIFPREIRREGVRDHGGRIIRQRQTAATFPAAGGVAVHTAVKLLAGDILLAHHLRHFWHGLADDLVRRRNIFFEQHRRQGQHVGDVVEAVAGVVRREHRRRVEVHAEQVADGVVILHAVEAADGDAAGIGILRVGGEDRAFDPLGEAFLFLRRGLGFFLRRHQAGAEIFQRVQPQLAVGKDFLVGLKFIEGHIALVRAVGMAVETIFFQKGAHVLVELQSAGHFRAGQGGGEGDGSQPAPGVPDFVQVDQQFHNAIAISGATIPAPRNVRGTRCKSRAMTSDFAPAPRPAQPPKKTLCRGRPFKWDWQRSGGVLNPGSNVG